MLQSQEGQLRTRRQDSLALRIAAALKRRTLRRLRELLVLRERHVPPQFNQDGLHGKISLPLNQARQLRRIDLAGHRVDAWEIDSREKGNIWRDIGVIVTTVDLEAVYAVLVGAVRRAQYSTVPVGHQQVVAILQADRASLCSEALLALLQLLQ